MKMLIPHACVLLAIGFVAHLVTPTAAAEPVARAPVVPAEQPDKPDKIKELQEKRIAVLKEILDITEKTFKGGQLSFEQVLKARLDLLQGQLDVSQTKEERIRLLEEMVKHAEALEEAIKRLVAAKQATTIDALKATAFVLETKIALERAKSAKRQ